MYLILLMDIASTDNNRKGWSCTALICGLMVIGLGLLFTHLFAEVFRNVLLTLLVGCVVFSFVALPSGPIQGPFAIIWKIVNGLALFYLIGLFYLCFHTRQQAINLITTHVDPSLQLLDYEQVSYGQDCRMVNPDSPNPYSNLMHSCFDLFALAHFLGWFFKTLICRDFKLIMFASVTFELIQYSLRNVLNNFKQCWWDHVIIDIFGCNLLGIACGFFVIDKFGLDRYRWSLRSAPLQHSHWQNFKRFCTTWDISYLQTKAFSSLRHFLKMAFFIVMFQANDLTLFFLKYIYQIPPSHFICVSRVWVLGLLCVNAAREYYDFMKLRTKFRRTNLLLLNSIIWTQAFIVITQGKDQFGHAYIDDYGQTFLGIIFMIFLVLFIKIGASDVIRKFKGFQERKEKLKEAEMEMAKLEVNQQSVQTLKTE